MQPLLTLDLLSMSSMPSDRLASTKLLQKTKKKKKKKKKHEEKWRTLAQALQVIGDALFFKTQQDDGLKNPETWYDDKEVNPAETIEPESTEHLPSAGKEAGQVISKLLEMTGYSSFYITSKSQVYASKKGSFKACYLFFKPEKESLNMFVSCAPSISVSHDTSWVDLPEDQLPAFVLESLCGSFFAFDNRNVCCIPSASSVAELGLKLDIMPSIVIPYIELAGKFHIPCWLAEKDKKNA